MPASYSQRLLSAVRQAPRPVVRLWLWPGMQLTLDALKSASRPWTDRAQASAGEDRDVWFWQEPGGISESFVLQAAELKAGERLWFVETRRQPAASSLVVADLAMELLLPSVDDLETMLGERLGSQVALSTAQLERIHAATDGWPEPALWLASRWRGDGGLDQHLDAPEFRQFVIEKVLRDVEPEVLDVLTHLAGTGDDAEASRERWLDQPSKLGALEVAERAWGWRRLGRLPRVLSRTLAGSSDGPEKAPQSSAATPERPSVPGPVEASTSPKFRLQLLGWPRILRRNADGSYVETRWRLRRSLSMVAYLALRPDLRASREELIAAIWPDASPETIRKNFHPAISDARRALGSPPNPIVFRQSVYLLTDDVEWELDSRRFEQLVAEAKRAVNGVEPAAERALHLLEQALTHYRGPLLEGMDAEWLTGHRQRLRRVKLDLLLNLGDLARGLGEDLKALDAYRALLFEEPFEEQIHLRTMELYARQGRRDLVRRQYIRLQELLKELNVEPAAETQDRYHQLMR